MTQIRTRWAERLRKWRKSLGADISTPRARRRAVWHFYWLDHGVVRLWWWNFDTVAPGVFRSNQPSAQRLARYRKMGIRSVLNLRGEGSNSAYLFEAEACAQLDLDLTNIATRARSLPTRETILELESAFRTLPKPMILHCKSGSDRAGFAAALYLMLIEGTAVRVAQRQLGLKYAHLRTTRAGILDFFLDHYAADNGRDAIGFRDWVVTRYDREAMLAAYAAKRAGGFRA